MKKFLIIATLLAIAVFASAYTSRNFWIELQLDQLDIMNYVDTAFPGHDADFVLSVTDGIDVISTETHDPVVIKVTVNAGPNGPVAWATFTAAGFSTPGYSWNKTFTITITYPGNTDPETNSATMSYTTAASGNAAIWLYGDNAWQLPDSIILGAAAPTTTYTLNIAINDDVLTTPGTYTINGQPYQAQLVDDNDEVNDLIGTYTISDAPEGFYWLVNPIVVSATDFDPETNIANITFVLAANPVIDTWTYKLMLTASDGGAYNFTGPVSGVTGTECISDPLTEPINPFIGTFTVTSPPPEGFLWVNTEVTLVGGDFLGAKADHVFAATKQFELQLTPITYTLNIVFPDGYTITGPGGPFTTSPAVVTDNDDTVNDLIGNVYTASDAPAGFHWITNPITVVAEMFTGNAATITFALEQDEEPPVPVELSSFTATLTGQFYVQLSWTTQTETQMVGYRVYRSTTADQSTIELIDNPLVPATNTSTTQNYTVVDKDVLIGQTYYYWLEAVDYNNSNFHGPVSVTVTGNVPPVLPEATEMKNAYPNPFKANSSTNIEVSLKEGDSGTLSIYNVQGQLVKIVSLTEGTHMVNWNGRDTRGNVCGSGIYFYKLSTQSMNQTKKMVIVK